MAKASVDKLLQKAEAIHRARLESEQEAFRQALTPTTFSRWDAAVANLTRDPGIDLNRKVGPAEACPILAHAWRVFSNIILNDPLLKSRARNLQEDENDARNAAVKLFHLAANGASEEEFKQHLAFIASDPHLFPYRLHVDRLARDIWDGKKRPETPWETAAEQMQEQEPAKQARPRLTIDLESKAVTLDDTVYSSLDPDAIRILQAIHLAARVITGPELQELRGCKGKRIDRCLRKLPSPLRKIVESATGKGYWIELPPRPSA
jgi:hypothetical protein